MAKKESTATKVNIGKELNKQVANGNVLYVKLHNYHWYVKGPNFFTLHVKFEELYNEVTLMMDEIAERMLAIGEKPSATMKEYMQLATIKEAQGGEDPTEMVQNIADDYRAMVKDFLELAEAAEEEDDMPTSDMLIGMVEKLQKHIWMLDSYAGK
ncbi:DNA starvation/stationary phase protection protein [Paenibacillus sambharensis]|uniref:DNA starvation/stationary phase protection protein n=1 Tax=Paenibacillus sambharensis TaxID=1803190 RepID=A0A2W1M1K1_9BACL|nr:DNA starvation/stationary phase protection protein [Paenibacillus sambharensis]PZD97791.1 DNA starvation/stationary phase protection protein [Paenibacillus sambharensis]